MSATGMWRRRDFDFSFTELLECRICAAFVFKIKKKKKNTVFVFEVLGVLKLFHCLALTVQRSFVIPVSWSAQRQADNVHNAKPFNWMPLFVCTNTGGRGEHLVYALYLFWRQNLFWLPGANGTLAVKITCYVTRAHSHLGAIIIYCLCYIVYGFILRNGVFPVFT